MAKDIETCTYLPGSFEKRFAAHMGAIATDNPTKQLTERQSDWLKKQHFRYRKQIQKRNTYKK